MEYDVYFTAMLQVEADDEQEAKREAERMLLKNSLYLDDVNIDEVEPAD